MDTIRSAYHGFVDFCNRVVQWRSAFTVPYVFAVNTAFWAMVYYATVDTQMKTLAAVACIVFFNDVLLAPTHERSIIVQILLWPIRDFWKTTAVILFGIAIHQLGEGNKDEAMWCSFVGVALLLISPVYRYNQVNQKIINSINSFGSLCKRILTYCIVRPILYVYEGLKYVFLLKWLPGLNNWLRSLRANIYDTIDRMFLQRVRAFGKRCAEIFRYWFYFQWVADLKALLYKHLGEPAVQKLRVLRDYFTYVFGGYWFYPMMRSFGRMTLNLSYYLMGVANRCAIAIGNSVVWPLVVLAYDQCRQVALIVYDAVGRPVVNVLARKYKIVEDMAFIYFIGPLVSLLVKCVPEKNPFYDETMEKELDEFIPGPVGGAEEVEEEERAAQAERQDKEEEFVDELGLHDEDLDDLDDDQFLRRRLERDLSMTDSSDEEFLIFPKKSGGTTSRQQRRPAAGTSS